MLTFFSNNITRFIVFAVFSGLLTACGGGGGSDDAETVMDTMLDDDTDTTARNVALASNGATVSSTFSGNEMFVIDGDTSTDNFWEPGAMDDTLTIDFSQVYAVESVRIRSANLTSNNDFSWALSTDGVNFAYFNVISSCFSFSLGGSGYYCELTQMEGTLLTSHHFAKSRHN